MLWQRKGIVNRIKVWDINRQKDYDGNITLKNEYTHLQCRICTLYRTNLLCFIPLFGPVFLYIDGVIAQRKLASSTLCKYTWALYYMLVRLLKYIRWVFRLRLHIQSMSQFVRRLEMGSMHSMMPMLLSKSSKVQATNSDVDSTCKRSLTLLALRVSNPSANVC